MQLFTNMGAPLFLLPLYNYVILIHLPQSSHLGASWFFLAQAGSFFFFLFFFEYSFLSSTHSMGNKSSREDDGGTCEAKENSFNVFDPCGRCELFPLLMLFTLRDMCSDLVQILNIFLCISYPIHASSHMQHHHISHMQVQDPALSKSDYLHCQRLYWPHDRLRDREHCPGISSTSPHKCGHLFSLSN
jgi:hypothetical protein